jgi:hypothetical protein
MPKPDYSRLTFKTPEELRVQAFEYIQKPDEVVVKTIRKEGQPDEKVTKPVATISGMALRLGFNDRFQMYRFANSHPDYGESIDYARALITMSFEQLAVVSQNPAAPIFLLKNLGYADRVETTSSVHEIKEIKVSFIDHTRKIGPDGQPLPASEDNSAELKAMAPKLLE